MSFQLFILLALLTMAVGYLVKRSQASDSKEKPDVSAERIVPVVKEETPKPGAMCFDQQLPCIDD